MAATDQSHGPTTADTDALIGAVQDAEFVTIVARADGVGAAAAGLLADALESAGTPHQVSLTSTAGAASERLEDATDTRTSVSLGHPSAVADVATPPGHTLTSVASAAEALGGRPDPTVAMAGIVAGGTHPSKAPAAIQRLGEWSGRREPGIARPGTDAVDSLAHTTLLHGPFAGDREAARDLVEEVEPAADGTALASAVVLAAAGPDRRPPSAGAAVERGVRPVRVEGSWDSIEAFADILAATAREAPGVAIGLALGRVEPPAARDPWRTHGAAVHEAVRAAELARYDGFVQADLDGSAPLGPTARLLRDFRAPEPAVFAVGPERVGVATTETDARARLSEAAGTDAVGGHATVAVARTDDPEHLADTLREHHE
ncbi:MAG: hypothetical protein ABEJ35_06665 [Halobacteriaceae archaeon]